MLLQAARQPIGRHVLRHIAPYGILAVCHAHSTQELSALDPEDKSFDLNGISVTKVQPSSASVSRGMLASPKTPHTFHLRE